MTPKPKGYQMTHAAKQLASAAAATLLILLPLQNSAADQTTTQTATSPSPKPEPDNLFEIHYEARVRSFSEQNRAYQNVVLLGDSITEGFDLDKYLPGRRILNRGIGGDIIGNDAAPDDKRGVLKRLDESVFHCAPTHLFILIGINDLGQGHTPQQIEQGYHELLTKIRERLPKLEIYVQSVLPARDRFAKHKPAIIDVNQRLIKLAHQFDCHYIDLHSKMADDKGHLKAEFTADGLHLKPPAYKLWATILQEQIGWTTP